MDKEIESKVRTCAILEMMLVGGGGGWMREGKSTQHQDVDIYTNNKNTKWYTVRTIRDLHHIFVSAYFCQIVVTEKKMYHVLCIIPCLLSLLILKNILLIDLWLLSNVHISADFSVVSSICSVLWTVVFGSPWLVLITHFFFPSVKGYFVVFVMLGIRKTKRYTTVFVWFKHFSWHNLHIQPCLLLQLAPTPNLAFNHSYLAQLLTPPQEYS